MMMLRMVRIGNAVGDGNYCHLRSQPVLLRHRTKRTALKFVLGLLFVSSPIFSLPCMPHQKSTRDEGTV